MDLNTIFIKILNMGIAATYVILIVMAMRVLFLRKLPRIYSYCLWALVGVRLLFPVLLSSAFSFFNLDAFWKVTEEPGQRMAFISQEIEYELIPQINTGSTFVDQSVNRILPPANLQGSVNPLQIWFFVGEWIWIAGIVIMLGYMLVSYLRVRNRVKYAVRMQGVLDIDISKNKFERVVVNDEREMKNYQKERGCKRRAPWRRQVSVYECDGISSPFVFGVFRPRIYIPFHLEEKALEYILAHEWYHIRRGDPIVKMLAFLIVCIYWFHPLVWISYVLLEKDMEMSCDEKVLQTLGGEIKEDYSRSLLSFATGKGWHIIQPLAFGESFAGMRIRNVLRFRKPALWLSLSGVILVVILSLICLTDREKENIVRVESTDVMGVGDFAANIEYSFAPDINSYLIYVEAYDPNGEYLGQGNLAAEDLKRGRRSGSDILSMGVSRNSNAGTAWFDISYRKVNETEDAAFSDIGIGDGEQKFYLEDCMGFSAVFGKTGDGAYTMEADQPCIIGTGYTVNRGENRLEAYTPEQLRAAGTVDDNVILLTNNGCSFIVYMVASEQDCKTLLETYPERTAAKEQNTVLNTNKS